MTDAQRRLWVDGPTHFFAPRLSNNANYCYLNSVVHVLAQNLHFRRALYEAAKLAEEATPSSQDPAVVDLSKPHAVAVDVESQQEAERKAAPTLTACPMAVMCKTFRDYFSGAEVMPPSVLTLADVRTLMREIDKTYRAGMMNDAAEALECIVSLVDGDAAAHRPADPYSGPSQSTCVRYGGTTDTMQHTRVVVQGEREPLLSALGAELAFSRIQTWSCRTSTCSYVTTRGVKCHTQRDVYYLRLVNVYPLLYGEQEGPTKSFVDSSPEASFSELVAQRQPREEAKFVCPGCGEHTSTKTTWVAPVSSGVVQLAWHVVRPPPAERKRVLTHVLSSRVRLEEFVTWGSPPQQAQQPGPWFRLTSMVLLRSQHYVTLMLDAESSKWYLGNDQRPIVEVGSSWDEAARFIWRASLIPFLLCFTKCSDDAEGTQETRRPTSDFLDTPPPKVAPPSVDTRQRTLDAWMAPQERAAKSSSDADGSQLLPRKRPRETSTTMDVDDDPIFPSTAPPSPSHEDGKQRRLDASNGSPSPNHIGAHVYVPPPVTPVLKGVEASPVSSTSWSSALDALSECFSTMPKTVIAEVLSRANGNREEAAEQLNRRLAAGAMVATPSASSRGYDPLGAIHRIGGSIRDGVGSVMERARNSFSSAPSVVANVQPPRAFKAEPVIGLPLIGNTFTILVVPQSAIKALQASINSFGGTVARRSHHRVMSSFALIDMTYMQGLSRRAVLHTNSNIVDLLHEYKDGGLLRTSVIDMTTKRLAPFSQLKSSSEFCIDFSEVKSLLENSQKRAMSQPQGTDGAQPGRNTQRATTVPTTATLAPPMQRQLVLPGIEVDDSDNNEEVVEFHVL